MTYETEQIPIVEAGAILSELPERLAEEDQTVALTVHGRPALAVMTWALFESIVETMEIMGDEDMMATLRRGIQDVREGSLIPIEQAVSPPGSQRSTEPNSLVEATSGMISVDQETFEAVVKEWLS